MHNNLSLESLRVSTTILLLQNIDSRSISKEEDRMPLTKGLDNIRLIANIPAI